MFESEATRHMYVVPMLYMYVYEHDVRLSVCHTPTELGTCAVVSRYSPTQPAEACNCDLFVVVYDLDL